MLVRWFYRGDGAVTACSTSARCSTLPSVSGSGVDPARVAALKEREDEAFAALRPRSLALWDAGQAVMPNGVPMSWLRTSYDHLPLFIESAAGSRLRDVDGHEYADFNIADMSMFTGYGPAPVVEAVSRQVALGSQYLLPTEDSIWVAGELARRYGLPLWQFTLAATSANTEVIRIARSSSGRENDRYSERMVSIREISEATTASRSWVRSDSGVRAIS